MSITPPMDVTRTHPDVSAANTALPPPDEALLAAENPPGVPANSPPAPVLNWKSEVGKLGLVIFGCCWLLGTLWLVSSNSPSATGPYVEGPALLMTPTVNAGGSDDDRLSPTWVVSRGSRLLTPVPTLPPGAGGR